jgi:Domain of unknown function (DUF243)
VYVHVAPEEPAGPVSFGPGAAPAGPVQKHYKIIFIKAPSYSQQLAQQQASIAQAAAQEKTLVYVLSKKPDDLVQGDAPGVAAPAFTPSKPEVYFIKYKAQSGASSGGNGGGFGGAGGAGGGFGGSGFGGSAGGASFDAGSISGGASFSGSGPHSSYGVPL